MRRAISNIETRLPMEIVTRWSNFVRDEFRRRAQNHLIGHTQVSVGGRPLQNVVKKVFVVSDHYIGNLECLV
jgi:hypothetical protein